MRRSRWLQRGIAAGIVLGAVTLVIAATGPNLVVTPSVMESHMALNQGGSGFGYVTNTGDGSATVTSIVSDSSCSTLGVSTLPSTSFTLDPTQMQGLTLLCSPVSNYGIRRCPQHLKGAGNQTFTSYTALCITEGTSMFMPSTSSINFPPTQVGMTSATQTRMIFNPAGNPGSTMVAFQIGDQDGNFEITAPCLTTGPGCDFPLIVGAPGTFSVTVQCRPQTVGMHMAPLHIVGNGGTHLMPPILLSCMGTMAGGTPAMSVNPSSVSLSHPVGMGSASTMVHVSNIGAGDLNITSIVPSGSSDWSYTTSGLCAPQPPCTIPPTMGFDLTTTFTPTAIGARDTTLTINSNDSNDPMYQLNLFGTGQGATIALASNLGTPPMLDLGTSPIGIPTMATFDLRNDGNIVLNGVNLALAQSGSELTVTPNPTTIDAAGMQQITVMCTPTAADVYTATLDITAPSALSGSPISIMVRCTGTAGSLFATPSTVQLGEIRTGSPRVTRTIMLKTAGGPLTITAPPMLSPSVTGMGVGVPSSNTITMAAPASFDLTVDATVDQDLATSIEVTASGDMLDIPVTGKVVTAKIGYPASIMVGSFCVGQQTTAATGRLSATGTATIGLATKPVMNKMSASPFQLMYTSPVGYPYQLPAGQSAMVDITPLRQMLEGTQTDDIVWATDVAGDTAPRTMVTAEFIADGGAIAPQLVDFGSVRLRESGEPRVIKIQNCGMESMTLDGPFIDPSGDFIDDSPAPLTQTLAPNQIATINVNFTPKKIGTRMATLSVDSSKGPLSVTLLGLGVDDPGKIIDLDSFYACNNCTTNDPSAAWPAVLVVLLLRRRRRR